MFIPLSVVSLCISIVIVGVSFLLLALFSENPKKSIVVWTILFFGGILLFFVSCIWGLVELIMSVV